MRKLFKRWRFDLAVWLAIQSDADQFFANLGRVSLQARYDDEIARLRERHRVAVAQAFTDGWNKAKADRSRMLIGSLLNDARESKRRVN